MLSWILQHAVWQAFIPIIAMVVVGWFLFPHTVEEPATHTDTIDMTQPNNGGSSTASALTTSSSTSSQPSNIESTLSQCPPTNITIIPSQFDATSVAGLEFCGYRPPIETAALMVHGDQAWELRDMPIELREYVLTWGIRVSAETAVPLWAILAIWRSESMGESGFRPLETRISGSCAIGPGQVTGPYWDGRDFPREQWRSCKPFETDPARILPNGCGRDFDGDKVANPFSVVDNMAATACGLHDSGVTTANCSNATNCQGLLAEAMYAYLGARNTEYAGYGITWAISVNTDANLIASANCTISGDTVDCN